MPPTSLMFWMALQRIEGYDRLIVRWWWFAVALAALMILLASWKLIVQTLLWWNKPRSNPKRLLQQLSRVHKLTKEELKLFQQLVAKLPSGTHPAILFVDPSSWSWKHVHEMTARQSLEKLYSKIFGFPPDLAGG
jgi:hypothetical protein